MTRKSTKNKALPHIRERERENLLSLLPFSLSIELAFPFLSLSFPLLLLFTLSLWGLHLCPNVGGVDAKNETFFAFSRWFSLQIMLQECNQASKPHRQTERERRISSFFSSWSSSYRSSSGVALHHIHSKIDFINETVEFFFFFFFCLSFVLPYFLVVLRALLHQRNERGSSRRRK